MKNHALLYSFCLLLLIPVSASAQYMGTLPAYSESGSQEIKPHPTERKAEKAVERRLSKQQGETKVDLKVQDDTAPLRKETFDPSFAPADARAANIKESSGMFVPAGKKGHWAPAPVWSMTFSPQWIEDK